MLASRLPGAETFALSLEEIGLRGNSARTEEPDLTGVPEEYHDFADVFSKGKADTLVPH